MGETGTEKVTNCPKAKLFHWPSWNNTQESLLAAIFAVETNPDQKTGLGAKHLIVIRCTSRSYRAQKPAVIIYMVILLCASLHIFAVCQTCVCYLSCWCFLYMWEDMCAHGTKPFQSLWVPCLGNLLCRTASLVKTYPLKCPARVSSELGSPRQPTQGESINVSFAVSCIRSHLLLHEWKSECMNPEIFLFF